MTATRLFALDEDHEALRDLTRQVVAERVAPNAASVDESGEFPAASLKALVEAGLHAIGIPEMYGGQGGGLLASAVVAEQIAYGCATTQQVRDTFRFAFDHIKPNDGVNVGMFQKHKNQVRENAGFVREILERRNR